MSDKTCCIKQFAFITSIRLIALSGFLQNDPVCVVVCTRVLPERTMWNRHTHEQELQLSHSNDFSDQRWYTIFSNLAPF